MYHVIIQGLNARLARRHFIWQYVDWNRVLFSGETRFALRNAGGKTHKQALWDCYVLERDRFGGGSFVVWGGKMGDQKTYFVVLQDNFNALYRRHLVTSCHTISPLFLHIKIEVIFRMKTKQKKNIKCNVVVVFCAKKFPERCEYFELNAMCR